MQLPPWPEKAKAPMLSPCVSTLQVHLGRNTDLLSKLGCPVLNTLRFMGLKRKEGSSTAWYCPASGSELVVEVSPFLVPLHEMFMHGLQHPNWWFGHIPGEALHAYWHLALPLLA